MMSGMDDDEEDDHFFADDLDDLPVNAWNELEQNAIQSTQHARFESVGKKHEYAAPRAYPGVAYQQAEPRLSTAQPNQLPGNLHLPQQRHTTKKPIAQAIDTTRYEDAEIPTPLEEKEAFSPPNARDGQAQREGRQQHRYAEGSRAAAACAMPYRQPDAANYAGYEVDEHNLDVAMDDVIALNGGNEAWANQQVNAEREQALQVQIAKLLRERDDLARELHSAKSAAMTQQGEISIIRANQAKERNVLAGRRRQA
jgi:hypothetical protein